MTTPNPVNEGNPEFSSMRLRARRVTFPNDPPQDPSQFPPFVHKRIRNPSPVFESSLNPLPTPTPVRAPSPYPHPHLLLRPTGAVETASGTLRRWGTCDLSTLVGEGDGGWYLLPFIVCFCHVLLSPYTKVEESPTLHAVHDVLVHGIRSEQVETYEHVLYPGPVVRSFVPPLLLASVVWPISALFRVKDGMDLQILIRLTQVTLFCLSLNHLASTLKKVYDKPTARSFLVLVLTSFHIPYYAGRTLPNLFALPIVMFAFSLVLRTERMTVDYVQETQSGDDPENAKFTTDLVDEDAAPDPSVSVYHNNPATGGVAGAGNSLHFALGLMTWTATVCRLELAPMALTLALVLVVQGRMSTDHAVLSGAAGGLAGLAMTAITDPHFYRPFTALAESPYTIVWWPELSAFVFNIVHGRSKEWGQSPVWYYAPQVIKLCMAGGPLALVGLWAECSDAGPGEQGDLGPSPNPNPAVERNESTGSGSRGGGIVRKTESTALKHRRRRVALLLACVAGCVVPLSLVGHKEWRFIIYAIPLLLILSARGLAYLWRLSSAPHALTGPIAFVFRLFSGKVILFLLIIANMWASALMARVSGDNYPGAQVGWRVVLLALRSGVDEAKIWVPAAALHSGLTLFTLPPSPPQTPSSTDGGSTDVFYSYFTHLMRYDSDLALELIQDIDDGPSHIQPSSARPPVTLATLDSGLAAHLNLTFVRPESAYERCSKPYGNSPTELWEDGYTWVVTDDPYPFMQLGTERHLSQWKKRWAVDDEIHGYVGVGLAGTERGRRLSILRRLEVEDPKGQQN